MLQEKQKPKPKPGDTVSRIQKYAMEEAERNRKAEEEKKKKKKAGTVETAPEEGFVSRLYRYFSGTKEEEKKK